MCHHEKCLVPHKRRQGVEDRPFHQAVQRRRGLVKHQDVRLLDQRPGDGQTLSLSFRQVDTPFAHRCFIPLRQTDDELVDARDPGGPNDLLLAGLGVAVAQVVADCARQEKGALRYVADALAERAQFVRRARQAVEPDLALRRFVEAQDQAHQRRLAHAAGTHDGHVLSRPDETRHVLKHGFTAVVGEGDVLESDLAAEPLDLPAGAQTLFWNDVEEGRHPFQRDQGVLQLQVGCGQELGRAVHVAQVGLECQQRAQAPIAPDHPVCSHDQDDGARDVGQGVDGQVGNRTDGDLLQRDLKGSPKLGHQVTHGSLLCHKGLDEGSGR